MKRENEVTAELESMGSILAGMSRAMPYVVPEGYFDKSGERRAESDGDTQLWLGNSAMPYAVPQGYFEGLADNILAVATAESDVVLRSVKKMSYSVPAGYFEALPGQVLQSAKNAEPVRKQVKIIPLRPAFVPVRWAVAAVLLVCITLGGYISFFSEEQNGTEEILLASVSKEELQDYLQRSYVMDVNRVDNANDINQLEVDGRDIEQYLNETGWDVVD